MLAYVLVGGTSFTERHHHQGPGPRNMYFLRTRVTESTLLTRRRLLTYPDAPPYLPRCAYVLAQMRLLTFLLTKARLLTQTRVLTYPDARTYLVAQVRLLACLPKHSSVRVAQP